MQGIDARTRDYSLLVCYEKNGKVSEWQRIYKQASQ